MISSSMSGGEWLWSNGVTTQNITLTNVTRDASYRVTYKLNGNEYRLQYDFYLSATSKTIEERAYYIKDAATGNYLINVGDTPIFHPFQKDQPESQIWLLELGGVRYK